MSQTRKHSMIETITNISLGYVIATSSQIFIFPLYNINISISENLEIGLFFTIVSIIRSYTLRRFFNKITVNNLTTNKK